MTTSTPTLGLVLYNSSTDQAATFAAFRADMAGPASSSNFYKIDTEVTDLRADITALQTSAGAVYVPALYASPGAYTATGITAISAYTTGLQIIISVDTTIDGTTTVNINSLGAKSLMKVDSSGTPINLTGSDLSIGRYYLFRYDGTRFLWVSANTADQIKIVGTAANVVTVNTDNTLLGTTTQSVLLSGATNSATTKATPVDADEIPIVDSAAANVLKKLTWANLKATAKTYFDTLYVIAASFATSFAAIINAASSKTTPVDADEIGITDSAAGYALKKLTWANVKATSKTYFDSLYVAIASIATSIASAITGATEKTTPVNADEFAITDSAASYALKKLTLANLKSAVGAYYDTLSTTMTNKTLTTPLISSISNGGTVTIPSGTDTLVAKATTDTLTNKRITSRVSSTASSSTPTPNADTDDYYVLTALAAGATFGAPTGTPTQGQKLIIRIKDNATARSLAWNSGAGGYRNMGTALPTTTVLSKTLYLGFIYNSTDSKWDLVASAQEA